MPTKPRTLRPRAQPDAGQYERDRGSAASRGYDRRWQAAREAHLLANPLCAYCELEKRITAAALVDHLYPHRRFRGVFWRVEWWVSSCVACHSGFKQRIEHQGRGALDALARQLGRTPMGVGGVESQGPREG